MNRRNALLAAALAPFAKSASAGILDFFNAVKVGAKLPEFDAEYLGSMPSEDRKLLLVDFWATWCAPCRDEFPRLNELNATYSARGLEVIGLTQESKVVAQAFLPKVDIKYKLGAGGTKPLQKTLGIKALPNAILVDRKAMIAWRGQASELAAADIERRLKSAASHT